MIPRRRDSLRLLLRVALAVLRGDAYLLETNPGPSVRPIRKDA